MNIIISVLQSLFDPLAFSGSDSRIGNILSIIRSQISQLILSNEMLFTQARSISNYNLTRILVRHDDRGDWKAASIRVWIVRG